jgi:hypothetical protein
VTDADFSLLYEEVVRVLLEFKLACRGTTFDSERFMVFGGSGLGVGETGSAAEAQGVWRAGVFERVQVFLVAFVDHCLAQYLFVEEEVEVEVVGGAFGLQSAVERIRD